MIKQITFITVILITLATIAGCEIEPTMFGLPQSQWKQLTKEQQDEIIRGYNEQQRIKHQNAVFMSAINTAGKIVKNNPD